MATLKISYRELSLASSYSKQASSDLDLYASKLQSGVAKKIGGISGGATNRTSNALSLTEQKIRGLKEKSKSLNDFSYEIKSFEEKVKETDEYVANRIKSSGSEFANANGIEIGKVSSFFQWIAAGITSTALGCWVKDIYNKAKDKVNEYKLNFLHWYKTGGGKYIINSVLTAISVVAAVVVIAVGGAGILAAIAIAAAVFTVINGVINIGFNMAAYIKFDKGDPMWANRYDKVNKLSDWLKFDNDSKLLEALANIYDFADTTIGLASAVVGIGKIGNKVLGFGKDKNLVSIKQLFGTSNKNGSVGILGSKFMTTVNNEKVFTVKSVTNGLKSIKTDANFRQNIGNSISLFKNEMTDIAKYNGAIFKQGNSVLKDIMSNDAMKKARGIEIMKNFAKVNIGSNVVNTLDNGWKRMYKSATVDMASVTKLQNSTTKLGNLLKNSNGQVNIVVNNIVRLDQMNKIYVKSGDIKNFTMPNISQLITNVNKATSSIQTLYKLCAS